MTDDQSPKRASQLDFQKQIRYWKYPYLNRCWQLLFDQVYKYLSTDLTVILQIILIFSEIFLRMIKRLTSAKKVQFKE